MTANNLGHVLLTTADRQTEAFTHGVNPSTSFEESLYDAILFRDGAVLPDIFAFISSAIAERQLVHHTMHLESAIEAGFVIPAFRRPCKSFFDSLTLTKRQGIQGLQPHPELIARRLDESLQSRKDGHPILWPTDISVDFGKSLIRGLETILATKLQEGEQYEGQNRELAATARFIRRHDILQKTIDEASEAEDGLRRGTTYNTLCKSLNTIVDSGKYVVHDSHADLLCHPACSSDIDTSTAIHNLVVLVNATYQLNMAKSLGVGGYAPGRLYAPRTRTALQVATRSVYKIHDDERFETSTDIQHLSVQVNLPSIRQLKAVPWADLLAIRKDVGRGYRAALKEWPTKPDEFIKCVQLYADALASRLRAKAPLTTIALQGLGESDKDALKSGAKLAIRVITENKTAGTLLGCR